MRTRVLMLGGVFALLAAATAAASHSTPPPDTPSVTVVAPMVVNTMHTEYAPTVFAAPSPLLAVEASRVAEPSIIRRQRSTWRFVRYASVNADKRPSAYNSDMRGWGFL
jgi:H+/gluconate symporter-like permease